MENIVRRNREDTKLSENLRSNSKGEFHLKYHGNKTRINFENMVDYERF